jgi:hypothetical protein
MLERELIQIVRFGIVHIFHCGQILILALIDGGIILKANLLVSIIKKFIRTLNGGRSRCHKFSTNHHIGLLKSLGGDIHLLNSIAWHGLRELNLLDIRVITHKRSHNGLGAGCLS